MSKYTDAIRKLAKMKALDAESAEKLLNAHAEEQDGGPGSGNFGHAGRPGKRGGSAPEGGGGGSSAASSSSSSASGQKMMGYGPTSGLSGKASKQQAEKWGKEFEETRNRDPFEGMSAKQKEDLKNRLMNQQKEKEDYLNKVNSQFPPSQRSMPNPPVGGEPKVDPSDDPTGRKDKAVAQFRNKKLNDANMAMADRCFEMKNSPEFANEPKAREVVERWENTLSKPQSGRPTPEQSKAATEKKLGNIAPELQPYFREVYEKRLKDEPKITNDICDIADELGAEMYGLDYRLKSAGLNEKGECRAAQKIAEDMDKNGWTYEQAVDNFSDMVRYTQACTEDTAVDQFEKTKAALEKKGYKFAKVKNTWDTFSEDNPYRGINCVVVSPSGTRFELQFHTPESIVGKEVQHPWYEEFRSDKVKPDRKKELGRKMYENMKKMRAPKNIGRISNYPPKGYD